MFAKHDTLVDRIFVTIIYLAMVLLVIIMLFPFWDQVIMSLSTRTAALKGGVRLWTWPMTLEAYRSVLKSRLLGQAYLNTIWRVITGTLWTVSLTALTAYPLSRDDFPFKGVFTGIILFTMMFSGGLIPNYLLRKSLHLIDKRIVLILPGVGAYTLIVVRNFFRSIPQELQEAAELDGATPFQTWLWVIMPLSKPVLATIALWSAVGHWNAFFDVLIYINDRSKYTVQIILRRAILENELRSMEIMPDPFMEEAMERPTPEMMKAALLILTTLPILFVYPFVQRYFIKGIMLGSVKG